MVLSFQTIRKKGVCQIYKYISPLVTQFSLKFKVYDNFHPIIRSSHVIIIKYCYVVHIQQMIHVAFPFISSLFDGFIIARHVSVYVYLLNLAKHLGWKKNKAEQAF